LKGYNAITSQQLNGSGGGGHQQAPVGIVNPTPRTNNKTLSTMDLRLLSTQHIPHEQKQFFRLSAPLCSNNFIPSNGPNHNGENNHINKRTESRSNDHFKSGNDVSTQFRLPENAINKSKSNMDISSYHRLQQMRMGYDEQQLNYRNNISAFNSGQTLNPMKCGLSRNNQVDQNNPMGFLSQSMFMGSSFPMPPSDKTTNHKSRFS